MFDNIGKQTKRKPKKTHKDVAKEVQKATAKPKQKKSIPPFKEGADGFVRSTISLPNNFARFLHEEVVYGNPIQKKMLTKVIMELLGEKYGREFSDWSDNRES